MLIIKIIYFCMLAIVVPYLSGMLLTFKMKRYVKDYFVFNYILGFLFMLAAFQVLCVPCAILQIAFHWLAGIYNVFMIFVMILSVVLNRKRSYIILKTEYKRIKSAPKICLLVILLIFIQTLIPVTFETGYSGDDDTYITISNDIVESDSLYLINAESGLEQSIQKVSYKVILTSFLAFVSFCGKISGIHVLIICRTLFPFILTPLAYSVYGLLGKLLFHDIEKVANFLIVLSVVHIFMGFSWYTISLRLLVCIWHGKAVLAAIILPFIFYYTLLVLSDYTAAELIVLMIVNVAASAVSLMGIGLAGIMVFIMAMVQTVENRDVRVLKGAVMSLIPMMAFSISQILIYMK